LEIIYPDGVGKFVLKRIGLALVTLFIVTTAIFFMTHILPGNAAERILGPFAERENVIALEKDLVSINPSTFSMEVAQRGTQWRPWRICSIP
jgi:ABC-type dipeptide/oligopeptide/nickel transport system permease component